MQSWRTIAARFSRALGPFQPNCYWSLCPGAGSLIWSPAMFKRVFSACVFVALGSVASEARPYRIHQAPECNVTMPCDFSYSQTRRERAARPSLASRSSLISRPTLQAYRSTQLTVTDAGSTTTPAAVSGAHGTRIVGGRPAGCPSSFCGCGAALRVFGRIVPELNLASNWLRFPRTSPAPGMVAARRGHVFVLEQHLGGDVWMAYDANSGGRATRIHARSLRGYTIVNPRGGSVA
ncbi:hypothetical protein ABH994_002991 [Bradyrhizobium yuanmingense]